jgi:hypothetical protein
MGSLVCGYYKSLAGESRECVRHGHCWHCAWQRRTEWRPIRQLTSSYRSSERERDSGYGCRRTTGSILPPAVTNGPTTTTTTTTVQRVQSYRGCTHCLDGIVCAMMSRRGRLFLGVSGRLRRTLGDTTPTLPVTTGRELVTDSYSTRHGRNKHNLYDRRVGYSLQGIKDGDGGLVYTARTAIQKKLHNGYTAARKARCRRRRAASVGRTHQSVRDVSTPTHPGTACSSPTAPRSFSKHTKSPWQPSLLLQSPSQRRHGLSAEQLRVVRSSAISSASDNVDWEGGFVGGGSSRIGSAVGRTVKAGSVVGTTTVGAGRAMGRTVVVDVGSGSGRTGVVATNSGATAGDGSTTGSSSVATALS